MCSNFRALPNPRCPELSNGVQDGCLMAISKRAKARMKIMSQSERAQVKKATKTLFDAELIGPKRMREIMRWADKR